MIAVTFALPNESSGFVKLLTNDRLHGHEVRVLHTGVGARTVNERVADFLEKTQPQLLLSAGFAGALMDDLRVGDLFVAENFSHPDLLSVVRSMKNLHFGKMITQTNITDSVEKRTELARTSGALAVDMETEPIARICRERNLPMLSLRAISDTPSAPFAIPQRVLFDLERQRTSLVRLAGHVLRHPSAIGQLANVAKQASTARRALTSALDLLLLEHIPVRA
jgi:adenosylhomocysteine nucleosidase